VREVRREEALAPSETARRGYRLLAIFSVGGRGQQAALNLQLTVDE
jgi:hypothetical protein